MKQTQKLASKQKKKKSNLAEKNPLFCPLESEFEFKSAYAYDSPESESDGLKSEELSEMLIVEVLIKYPAVKTVIDLSEKQFTAKSRIFQESAKKAAFKNN